jgi:UDP-GlcNAc3NAcA epimerase
MPEEINRVLVDHLSTLLFCPTRAAVDNLAREGVTAGVHHVGDVMYDTTLAATSIARSRSDILGKLGVADKSYAVATVHRAENTDDPARLGAVVAWLEAAAAALPVILPVHPRTRAKLAGLGRPLRNVVLVEPLGYLDMTELVSHSAAVYTDSGGLQKEAYFHRVPCVTLRDETEWVETIAAGWNRLWTVESYEPRHDIADYGDGHTSRAIAQLIRKTWATGRSSA